MDSKFDMATQFGLGQKGHRTVPGYAMPHAYYGTQVDPEYHLQQEKVEDFLDWMEFGTDSILYLGGPTGSGKSSFVQQCCARLNIPVVRINGRPSMQAHHILGHKTVLGGDVLFQDGPATTAARNGYVLLFDEIDVPEAGELVGLNTLAEGGDLTLEDNGGEVVKRHPNFRFVCTANTFGMGDATGSYLRNQQDQAFLDRAEFMLFDYPEPEVEVSMLEKRYPDFSGALIKSYVAVANSIRQAFKGGNDQGARIEVTMSTRTLLRWVDRSVKLKHRGARMGFNPIHKALDTVLALRTEEPTRLFMHEETQRQFGTNWKAT